MGRLCLGFCPLWFEGRAESTEAPFALGGGGGAVVGGGKDGFEPKAGLAPVGLRNGS